MIAYMYGGTQTGPCGAAGAASGSAWGCPPRATWARQSANPGQNANSVRMCVRLVRKQDTLHRSCHVGASGWYFPLSVRLIDW